MKIKVQSIHFDADKKLIQFVEGKVDKLKQFYDHILEGEVFLRLDKNVTQENKIAEIKISTPGKILFASEQCATFEQAADKSVEALKRQITKHKQKQRGI